MVLYRLSYAPLQISGGLCYFFLKIRPFGIFVINRESLLEIISRFLFIAHRIIGIAQIDHGNPVRRIQFYGLFISGYFLFPEVFIFCPGELKPVSKAEKIIREGRLGVQNNGFFVFRNSAFIVAVLNKNSRFVINFLDRLGKKRGGEKKHYEKKRKTQKAAQD